MSEYPRKRSECSGMSAGTPFVVKPVGADHGMGKLKYPVYILILHTVVNTVRSQPVIIENIHDQFTGIQVKP